MRILTISILSMVGLAGCANTPEADFPQAISRTELVTYVEEYWDDFKPRAAFLAGRGGQAPDLQGVGDAVCEPDDGDFACDFVARVRFADGYTAMPKIEINLRREADGRLVPLLMVVREPG